MYSPDCEAIVAERNYRFWNTESIGIGGLIYDSVNNLNLAGWHYGHAYLLVNNALPVYLGLNDQSKREPTSAAAHGGYQSKISQIAGLRDELQFPLQEDQLVLKVGANCGYNDECQSGKCGAISGRCASQKKENGQACNEDSDCQSDICAISSFAFLGICTSGTSGSLCFKNNDCVDGRCPWSFTCP